ncbi:MAG: hypothetical protein HKL90_05205 [Elusimicrobia bacterium]|nr:hypothetical protein [Elusimicrobiota bacterium]
MPGPERSRRRRGSALIVAVWTLSILSLLAVGAGYKTWLELKLTSIELDRIKEERLVLAAVQLARQVLPKDFEKPATLKDPWADNAALFKEVRLDEGTFSVVRRGPSDDPGGTAVYGLEDESGRLNLNTASLSQLEALLGEDGQDAAQAIIDWRQTPSDPQALSDIDSFYADLPRPYPCKHAAFESVAELRLVRAITPERYRRLRPWVTVHGRRVNINTAPRAVLLALGLSSDLTDKIVAYRDSAQAGDADPGDGVFTSAARISQNLDATPEENAQLNAVLPQLGVTSRDFRLHLEVWPGERPVAERRPVSYEIVLEYLTVGQWAVKQVSRAAR